MSDQAEVAEVPVDDPSAQVQPADEYSFVGGEEQEPEPVAESAPASEDNHDKKSNGVQERFNKMTAEKYELKDRNAALERQLEEMKQAQTVTAQPEPIAQPEAAKLPDTELQYDNPEEYTRQLAAYSQEQAIKAIKGEQQAAENARQQQEQVQAQRDLRVGFIAKAQEAGISEEQAFASISTLDSRGATPELAQALIQHDKAPSLLSHLAENPAVFDEINALSVTNPIGAAQKLLSIEAEAVTRNISSAPPPNTNLNGLSAREPDEFDKRCPGAVFT